MQRGPQASGRSRSPIRATTSARSPCSTPRSRTPCRATCTSRRSGGRWSSRSWWRSDVATRRRSTARSRPVARRVRGDRTRSTGSTARLTPDVVRSIIGLTLLVLGAMTLIALTLPGEGALTSWWTGVFAPWFGAMRWVAPFLLLLAGWWLEWGPGTRPGRAGGSPSSACSSPTPGSPGRPRSWACPADASGASSRATLTDLFSAPGAFVLLVALAILGVIVGFGIPLASARQAGRRDRPLDGHDRGRLAQADAGRGDEADDAKAAAAATAATAANGRTRQAGARRARSVARPDRRLGR